MPRAQRDDDEIRAFQSLFVRLHVAAQHISGEQGDHGAHEHIQRRFRQTIHRVVPVEAPTDAPAEAANVHNRLPCATLEQRKIDLAEERGCDDVRLQDGHDVIVLDLESTFQGSLQHECVR